MDIQWEVEGGRVRRKIGDRSLQQTAVITKGRGWNERETSSRRTKGCQPFSKVRDSFSQFLTKWQITGTVPRAVCSVRPENRGRLARIRAERVTTGHDTRDLCGNLWGYGCACRRVSVFSRMSLSYCLFSVHWQRVLRYYHWLQNGTVSLCKFILTR